MLRPPLLVEPTGCHWATAGFGFTGAACEAAGTVLQGELATGGLPFAAGFGVQALVVGLRDAVLLGRCEGLLFTPESETLLGLVSSFAGV